MYIYIYRTLIINNWFWWVIRVSIKYSRWSILIINSRIDPMDNFEDVFIWMLKTILVVIIAKRREGE